MRIDGAASHPTELVESIAMGSVAAPIPSYQPLLPKGLIEAGVLSAAQLETVIYAGNAFERDIPGRSVPQNEGCTLSAAGNDEQGRAYRHGYFLGDGTGAGKGRQIAAVIMDQWQRGNRRHIWLTKNETLLEDARRDWTAIGGVGLDIQSLSAWKLGEAIQMGDGILFVTYPTLRSGRENTSRLDQILAWAGEDFEGVIAFDESHAMANAAGGEGSRGKVDGSLQGVTGVRLQNLTPRSRVLYASATGASDVNNLAYACRLGLWGPETAFVTRDRFVEDIRKGGIAAMELVARDLKSLGLYTARALSFAGVEYDVLAHKLTDAQVRIYDAYAEAWEVIHNNLGAALEATNIVDGMSGETLNSGAKAAAKSVFEGTKQRFFGQLLLSMKLPSLIPAMEQDLEDNHSVVVQVVSTAEAMLNRQLATMTPEEREHLVLELSPREYVIDYLAKSFPVQLMQVYKDENGQARSQVMHDDDGNPVICRAAAAARDDLVERLCAMPAIGTALDALIARFGTDGVAEVTGRTRRLVPADDGGQRIERRSAKANIHETNAFMDGDKRVLVFSDAGGTGRSYHADLAAKNQQRRIHYLLEPGWRADAAIQGLGRTHRTCQASAPLFRPVTTDVKGERRFISTIARRLDSLGALTRGQRQTGGQNLFDPADNLESAYAKDALVRWFYLLAVGKLSAIGIDDFERKAGLRLRAEDGCLNEDLPPIQRWLNRVLAFPIALQNSIFDEYIGLVEARIAAARDAGTLDIGVETFAVDDYKVVADRCIRTDPSGATTHLLTLEIVHHIRPANLNHLMAVHGDDGRLMRNRKSGRVAFVVPASTFTSDEGNPVPRVKLIQPGRHRFMTVEDFEESIWTENRAERFQVDWNAEADELAATPRTEAVHMASGLLLPVWDKLPRDWMRVTRIVSEADGKAVLGREIPAISIPDLAKAFDIDIDIGLDAGGIADAVLQSGKAMPLAGPDEMILKRSLVNGSQRLELTGYDPERLRWYKTLGCFTEIIRYKTRLFMPPDKAGEIVEKMRG